MSTHHADLDDQEAQLRSVEERLHIIGAVATAMRDPVAVVRLLVECEDPADAHEALKRALALDDIQAAAVIDLQLRRTPRREREKLDAHVAELVDLRRVLRAQLDDRGEHRPDWRG